MKAFVAVTDYDWFQFLSRHPELPEVNFWQPSGNANFRALEPGQPLLFKLHAPNNFIAGGGFFAHFSLLPATLAWETFGIQNGAPNFAEMRRRIESYQREDTDPHRDYTIGCIILEDPFSLNIVRGRGYDLTTSPGKELWEAVAGNRAIALHLAAESCRMFGDPALFRPRLGQGAFRLAVTDTYERHCAVTGERTLPVLEAAHIRPVAQGGVHRLDNGLLLRSDIHTLFDRGYVTVTPDHRFRVSRRLRHDWQNGRVYYQLDGHQIWVPQRPDAKPNRQELEWHADTVFLG